MVPKAVSGMNYSLLGSPAFQHFLDIQEAIFYLPANIVKPVALCQSQKMSEDIQKKSINTRILIY